MLLRIAQAVYVEDNLVHLDAIPDLFPNWFDDSLKSNTPREASALKAMMEDGWKIILPRADYGHFVYLINANPSDGTLSIIDPWDGKAKRVHQSWAGGVRALHVKQEMPEPEPEPVEVLYGLHDLTGGEKMVAEGCKGYCLVKRKIQEHAISLNLTHLIDAGVIPILRLNWGWANEDGTLPPPNKRSAFVDACVNTINGCQGVYAVHVGNEPNNRGEHPPGYELRPDYVSNVYNEIGERVRDDVLYGPPPIDPYFGPGSDNSIWFKFMQEHAERLDILFFHTLKTQTNDPDLIWSMEMFQDEPLTWQYTNARATLTYLNMVLPKWRGVPVIVSEANPQHLHEIGSEIGWLPDNDEWVYESVAFVNDINAWAPQKIHGVIYYRYERAGGGQEGFAIEDKPKVLNAVLNLCK